MIVALNLVRGERGLELSAVGTSDRELHTPAPRGQLCVKSVDQKKADAQDQNHLRQRPKRFTRINGTIKGAGFKQTDREEDRGSEN